VDQFSSAGGSGKPRYGQVSVCWAPDEATARKTAHEWWASAAVPGELSQELALPRHFEQAVSLVREEDVAKNIICGPDPARHMEGIQKFLDLGVENVYIHQVGPDQDGFFDFYQKEILPRF
jgi:G6PDH family F420-dependent oxidoreductase